MRYQWHIFLAALAPTRGAEQAGRRPVLVISREQINQLLPVVNVIPLTSRKSASRVIYPQQSSVAGWCGWFESGLYRVVLSNSHTG